MQQCTLQHTVLRTLSFQLSLWFVTGAPQPVETEGSGAALEAAAPGAGPQQRQGTRVSQKKVDSVKVSPKTAQTIVIVFSVMTWHILCYHAILTGCMLSSSLLTAGNMLTCLLLGC